MVQLERQLDALPSLPAPPRVLVRPGEKDRYYPDHRARQPEPLLPMLLRELLPWLTAQVPVLVVSLLLWAVVPGIGAFIGAWLVMTLVAAGYVLRPVFQAARRNAHRNDRETTTAYGVYLLDEAVVVRQPGRTDYLPRQRIEEVFVASRSQRPGPLSVRYRDTDGSSRVAEVWSRAMAEEEAEVAEALEAWVTGPPTRR